MTLIGGYEEFTIPRKITGGALPLKGSNPFLGVINLNIEKKLIGDFVATEFIPFVLNFKDSIMLFLPKLLNSILIIFLGIIIGKITGKIVYVFLKKIHVDEYLSTETFNINFSGIISTFTRWWIYLGFLSAAFSKDVLAFRFENLIFS